MRPLINTYLAAYRGQEQLCREGVDATIKEAERRGEGYDVSVALYAEAVLHSGLGNYRAALDAASSGGARFDDLGMCGYLLAELIEPRRGATKTTPRPKRWSGYSNERTPAVLPRPTG